MSNRVLPSMTDWPRRLEITELVRGSAEARSLEQELDNAAQTQGVADSIRTAKSLRQWREELQLQGDIAELVAPDGKRYRFSLREWRDADPDQTLLRIGVRIFNPANYGSSGPAKHEYDLTQY